MMMRGALGALAAATLWLAAAASSADERPAAVDACTLLSADDVKAAIGLAVEPARRDDSGYTRDGAYSSTCLWRVAADKESKDPAKPLGGARFAILNVMQWPKGSGEAAKFLQSFRDAAASHIIGSDPVALKIGDEALWWGDGVAVRKADISFGISVHLIDRRPDERGIEEQLARKIAGRL